VAFFPEIAPVCLGDASEIPQNASGMLDGRDASAEMSPLGTLSSAVRFEYHCNS
jgi:hypothetical protein